MAGRDLQEKWKKGRTGNERGKMRKGAWYLAHRCYGLKDEGDKMVPSFFGRGSKRFGELYPFSRVYCQSFLLSKI